MTHAQYLETPEGLGYNLLNGLCCREEPSVDHQAVVRNVVGLLHRYARARRNGRALPAINVDLGEGDVPAPDACFVSQERLPRLHRRGLIGVAPDLCVEVLSPSTAHRDRGYKADLYARHGCREYWLVDGAAGAVEVQRPGPGGGLVRVGRHRMGDTFESAAVPGLRVDVDEVFAED